jgi:hypothetical protein
MMVGLIVAQFLLVGSTFLWWREVPRGASWSARAGGRGLDAVCGALHPKSSRMMEAFPSARGQILTAGVRVQERACPQDRLALLSPTR